MKPSIYNVNYTIKHKQVVKHPIWVFIVSPLLKAIISSPDTISISSLEGAFHFSSPRYDSPNKEARNMFN